MSDIPTPKKLDVGFSFDKNGVHTFALGWQLDSTRKTIRHHVEFSVDKRNFHRIPQECCEFAEPPARRVDVPFSEFVQFMRTCTDGKGKPLNIQNHRYLYWRVIAEFHDTAGKIFGHSTSNVAAFEMPELT